MRLYQKPYARVNSTFHMGMRNLKFHFTGFLNGRIYLKLQNMQKDFTFFAICAIVKVGREVTR